MKILLVNPPRSPHNAILANAPAEALPFIHRKLIGPPLGLLTVAAAVKHHDVTFLEAKGEYDLVPNAPDFETMVRDYLEQCRPDVVAVTVIASEFNSSLAALKAAKAFDPDIVTVAGGLHATVCPEDFTDPAVDVVCPGQSAHVFRHLVDCLDSGERLESVPGLLLNRSGGLTRTALPQAVNAADEDFLVPARHLLKRWLGTYVAGDGRFPATYIFTSLGCPYKCTFCAIWPQHEGRFQPRPVESIVAELKGLEEYPVVRFADANTIVNTKLIDELFDCIEAEGIKKDYVMDIRTDTAASNPKLIEKLARGGLKVVISGFESFRNAELARYNKSAEERLIKEAIRVFHENGVMIRGNYVVPPDYDRDDFEALAQYAGSHEVAYAGYTILTPMPGTIYHQEVVDDIVDHDLDKYNFFNSVMKTKLPLGEFYRQVGGLWSIRKGTDVI